jgi:hypothetical protein
LPKRANTEESRPDVPSVFPSDGEKPKAKEKSKAVAAAAKPSSAS